MARFGSRKYWWRLLRFFLTSLGLTLLSLPALLGGLFMLALLYPPCAAGGLTPGDFGYPWEDVTLTARAGGRFRGYFIPGHNGAAIIMPPATNSGRDGRLAEAAILARHGYAVFIFESRRCAGMGPLSLGYREVDEVADALAYLQSRPDVNPNRIGIQGFSSAGATAVMAAARLPALRAVVAEGGYGNFAGDTFVVNHSSLPAVYFQTLFFGGARLVYRLVTGLDISVLNPAGAIGQIAPRPVLLIYGSREVSLAGGRRQQAAAGNNATLWVVEGAGHGTYLQAAPKAYQARVVEFFNRSLP